ELSNALELKLFRREARPTQIRATATLVDDDARAGVTHRPTVVWDDALREARDLARAHARTTGCRSLDVLHCAAARALSASSFVTTDVRQRRLATAIGLKCT